MFKTPLALIGAFVAGLVAVSGTILPARGEAASVTMLVPTTALGSVNAVGVTGGTPPVYVATATGLYRSASPTFSWWTQQSTRSDIHALAPNPQHPDDLIYAATDGTYHSTDGGKTGQRVSTCSYHTITRSVANPLLLYAGSGSGLIAPCAPAPYGNGSSALTLASSTDDGLTWTTVYTSGMDAVDDGEASIAGIGAITINPNDPSSVFASDPGLKATGYLLGSRDNGTSWTTLQRYPLIYTYPHDIAIDPSETSVMWSVWGAAGLFGSTDSGHTWRYVAIQGLPADVQQDPTEVAVSPSMQLRDVVLTAVQVDPMSGRLYLIAQSQGQLIQPTAAPLTPSSNRQTFIYALDRQGHVDRFAPPTIDSGIKLTLTRNGYLLSWYAPDGYNVRSPLRVRPLIKAGNWTIAAAFVADQAAVTAAHLLGHPLSPTVLRDGWPCQFFDKGAVCALGLKGGAVNVALVPDLLNVRAALPVGGSTSSVSYATLYQAHNQRTPAPPGFRSGIVRFHEGVFIPYSPTLARASGYVVPAYFWHYIERTPRTAPQGWRQEYGLPLTPAMQATVTKGSSSKRAIIIQAFQDAVLTNDPQNPTAFQVERANIGADYADIFPRWTH